MILTKSRSLSGLIINRTKIVLVKTPQNKYDQKTPLSIFLVSKTLKALLFPSYSFTCSHPSFLILTTLILIPFPPWQDQFFPLSIMSAPSWFGVSWYYSIFFYHNCNCDGRRFHPNTIYFWIDAIDIDLPHNSPEHQNPW